VKRLFSATGVASYIQFSAFFNGLLGALTPIEDSRRFDFGPPRSENQNQSILIVLQFDSI